MAEAAPDATASGGRRLSPDDPEDDPEDGPGEKVPVIPDLEDAGSSAPCAVCSSPAGLRCSSCQAVFYCCRPHQRHHWCAHSASCCPYAVTYHRRLGRHLVATRAVRRGELILRDRPLMVGPVQQTAPLCLGCYRPTGPGSEWCPLPAGQAAAAQQVSAGYRCRRCGWPLCGAACEQSAQHRAECAVTARSPLGPLSAQEAAAGWFELVPLLRLLELRHACPADWTALLQLQSHDVERRGTHVYRQEQRTCVERIRNRFGQFQHSELLIHRLCGILDTNAYEIRLPEINIQGVYRRAAMLEHHCLPNTHRTFDEDLTLVVRAAVDIEQGAHLTSIYTDNLWGTWQRREHLLNSKHFLCICSRCRDPTELGTGLSSLRCLHCADGFLHADDPLLSDSPYTCDTCTCHVSGAVVRATVEELQEAVEAVEAEPTVEACENLISACSEVLHPNHHLMLDLLYPLVHLYDSSQPLPDHILKRKEELCRRFLNVADILTPGISRLRGVLLYELQQTILQEAWKQFKNEGKDLSVNCKFREARDLLREAVSVLRWEPRVQPEGQLGLEAADELAQLEDWLRQLAEPEAPEEGAAGAASTSEAGVRGGGGVASSEADATLMPSAAGKSDDWSEQADGKVFQGVAGNEPAGASAAGVQGGSKPQNGAVSCKQATEKAVSPEPAAVLNETVAV